MRSTRHIVRSDTPHAAAASPTKRRLSGDDFCAPASRSTTADRSSACDAPISSLISHLPFTGSLAPNHSEATIATVPRCGHAMTAALWNENLTRQRANHGYPRDPPWPATHRQLTRPSRRPCLR